MNRMYISLPFLLCAAVACSDIEPVEQEPQSQTAQSKTAQSEKRALLEADRGTSELDAESPDDARDFNLLAEVDVGNGNILEFYEPVPGRVLVMEHGINGNPKTRLAGRTPMEVYHSVAAGAPVPEALAAATRRADELWGGEVVFRGDPEMTVARDEPGFDCKDAEQFSEAFCAGEQSVYDVRLCLTNWWNGAWGQANYVNYHYGGLCPLNHTEPVRFRMWIDSSEDGPGWVQKASWLVSNGGWAQFSWVHHPENEFIFWLPPHLYCHLNTFHVHMKVDQASGKAFHFGFRSQNMDHWCNWGYVPMPGSGVGSPQPTGGL